MLRRCGLLILNFFHVERILKLWQVVQGFSTLFKCLLGMMNPIYCTWCFAFSVTGNMIGKINTCLANGALANGLYSQWTLQLLANMVVLWRMIEEFPSKSIKTISGFGELFVQVCASVTCLSWFFHYVVSVQTIIIYGQILLYVVIIFTTIMPQMLCEAEQWTLQQNTPFDKLQFDVNKQMQCANKLSSAYPSAYALQASMKPNFFVLITSVLLLLSKCLPSTLLGSDLKGVNMFVFKHLKGMFVWQCFVPILLGLYGNLGVRGWKMVK